MSFIDEKYISLVSSRLQKFTKKNQDYITSVVTIAVTLKSKRVKLVDTYIKSKTIITLSVIIVECLNLLLTF